MGLVKNHPKRAYIKQARVEKLLSRGFEKVKQQKWESAQSYFKRVVESNADECSTAFARVAVEACESAIAAPIKEARSVYEQVQRDRADTIPRNCLV